MIKKLKDKVYTINHDNFIKNCEFTIDDDRKIYLFSCGFDTSLYSDALFTEFSIDFPTQVKSALIKRKAEFLAGRIAAKEVLKRAQIRAGRQLTIGIGKHRSPIWPKAVVGSISHTHSHAICAVSLVQHNNCIGIDMEETMSVELASKIGHSIHLESEKKLLIDENIPDNVATTLIFSAKESLFKALYSSVGRYFDFNCAFVTGVSMTQNILYLRVTDELRKECIHIASDYACHFRISGNSLFTLVTKD